MSTRKSYPTDVTDDEGSLLEVFFSARPADDQKGFVPLPKRWMVERTLAWLPKCRRLSKDYEFDPQSSEAITRWASIKRMTKCLTSNST